MYLMIAEYLIIIVITLVVFYFLLRDENQVNRFIEEELSDNYVDHNLTNTSRIKHKLKKLGLTYRRFYVFLFNVFILMLTFGVTYLMFYNLIIAAIYAVVALMLTGYFINLKYRRIYSQFLFEQVTLYTSVLVSNYQKSKSLMVALNRIVTVANIKNPIKEDLEYMLEIIRDVGSIKEGLMYIEDRYNYYIIRDTHQLLYALEMIKNKDSINAPLQNMLGDIESLVENTNRYSKLKNHLYSNFMVIWLIMICSNFLFQFLVGVGEYQVLLEQLWFTIIINVVVILNLLIVISIERFVNMKIGE